MCLMMFENAAAQSQRVKIFAPTLTPQGKSQQISRGTSHSLRLTLRVRQRTLEVLGLSFRARVHECYEWLMDRC